MKKHNYHHLVRESIKTGSAVAKLLYYGLKVVEIVMKLSDLVSFYLIIPRNMHASPLLPSMDRKIRTEARPVDF
ncbi:MAG: hypothetical protein BM485_10615 [Desulfobulbaceae bacterium DB1]|nr:MAG: hypothetical protein BM485_14430 [Desulfobulbaceae bacterium DB1]OKY75038.1 MAG: hypothetical protein BM485_10615 [Desulfobulbaceae bacterium DB1]